MGRIFAMSVGEERRQTLVLVLLVMNFAGISIGLALCATAIYIRTSLEQKINFLSKYYNPTAVPAVLGVTGLIMIASSVYGITVCFKSKQEDEDDIDVEQTAEASKAMFIFLILSLVVLLLIFIGTIISIAQIWTLEKAFHKGLTDAMTRYKTELEMKKEVDYLQMDFQCCGVTGYQDWFKVSWIDKKYVDLKKKATAKKMKDGIYYTDDVPFSCCNIHLMYPCISERVHEDKTHFRYDYTVNLTLYTGGCRDALMKFYGRVMFRRVGLFIFFILILQVAMVTMTRYMQTAFYSLTEGDDPTVGWLITWGADIAEGGDDKSSAGSETLETDITTEAEEETETELTED